MVGYLDFGISHLKQNVRLQKGKCVLGRNPGTWWGVFRPCSEGEPDRKIRLEIRRQSTGLPKTKEKETPEARQRVGEGPPPPLLGSTATHNISICSVRFHNTWIGGMHSKSRSTAITRCRVTQPDVCHGARSQSMARTTAPMAWPRFPGKRNGRPWGGGGGEI